MEKRLMYKTPSQRNVELAAELNFLTSGSGENADPKDGNWTSPFDTFDE